jgi:hypothetical protein
MAVEAKLRHWVPWYEFAGTELDTMDEFQSILQKYRPSSILIACSRLNVAFNFGVEGGTSAEFERAKQWVPVVLPQKFIQRAFQYIEDERVLFFQAQLRFLSAEVVRLDPVPSETLPEVENEDLGELLLRAGELLYAPQERPRGKLDRLADDLARFLPIYEIDTPTDPFIPLMRFYIFLTINIPNLSSSHRRFDVEAEFEKIFAIPLKTYCNFMFALLMHARLERDRSEPYALIDAGIRTAWFKNTNLSTELIERIFETVCFTLAKLPDKKMPLGYADFEYLKDAPYFRHDNVLYCLDYDFALGKLESGALWRVLRSLPEKDQDPYLSFWGYVFEDYVSWILGTYASKKHNAVYPSPRYEDNPQKEICDTIIICGGTAILIEAKLGTCATTTRYSGDYKKMRKYLEEKLVVGGKKAAAVKQLLSTITKLTTSPPSVLPPWLRNIRKFIPLVITRDEIGSCWAINGYLNERFEEQLNRKSCRSHTITPLVCVSVSTLERCVRNIKEMPFAKILEDRIKGNRDLMRPFEAASNYVSRGTATGLDEHIKMLRQITEEIVKEFGMTE